MAGSDDMNQEGDAVTRIRYLLVFGLGALALLTIASPAPSAPENVIPIGQVQGAVADTDNGMTHRSSFAPPSGNSAGTTEVTVQAVVTQKTLARTSAGNPSHGIFVQNTTAIDDNNPLTSDGIFVFLGSFTTILRDAGPPAYTPQIGDEIRLRGRVSEFFFLSQLSAGLRLEEVIRSGVSLDAEVPSFETEPPDDLASANRYWERREGMRALLPTGAIVTGKRDVFPSTRDGEAWFIHPDHPADRPNRFTRRSFRDPHPLDNNRDPLFDDGNGYRIIIGSLGVKGAANDRELLITPARTFDELQNTLTGGVYFSFNKFQIMVGQQPVLMPGVDPSTNSPPLSVSRNREWSVSSFNVENLYDFRDDPHDGCDFADDPGAEPRCVGVNPPFDYVPASDAVYQERLGEIAQQIRLDLKAPDVILVQEAEDQDICTVVAAVLTCGTTNNADGMPDTLQELALRIKTQGGPAYDAAVDRDGADDRGIVSGFLHRTDRVQLLPALASDPVLGSSPQVVYDGTPLAYNTDVQNPKVLNADMPDRVDLSTGNDGTDVFTRAPQVGLFRIWRSQVGQGPSFDVYLVSNHFSSTPDARVGQRTEQALYNARIVDALQNVDSRVNAIVGGDLNVFPRPDDPFSPGQPLFPSDQLRALYEQGLRNLWNDLVDDYRPSAYGYVFVGQAQTLDQLFVTQNVHGELEDMRVAHINADWPADHPGDGARGTSDHDPPVARLGLLFGGGGGGGGSDDDEDADD
jgi:uncharacterized protein